MLDTLSILAANYLWYAIIGLAVVYVVSMIGGALYDDPRLCVLGHFSPLVPHKPNNGFPSDHVLWSAATAAIIFPSNRYQSIILWLLTILVGAARVHAGIHHPIDIAVSAL